MEKYKNKLWKDLNSDIERAEFIECGRAHETGIIAKAIENDLAKAYRKCAESISVTQNDIIQLLEDYSGKTKGEQWMLPECEFKNVAKDLVKLLERWKSIKK